MRVVAPGRDSAIATAIPRRCVTGQPLLGNGGAYTQIILFANQEQCCIHLCSFTLKPSSDMLAGRILTWYSCSYSTYHNIHSVHLGQKLDYTTI
eukprot:366546-Chlamydomonas_euryale.AAC.21